MRVEIRQVAILLISFIISGPGVTSCRETSVPKPRGYFRIDFPEKEYQVFDTDCPFVFAYPVYGTIGYDQYTTEPCWFNILFNEYKGELHISYKKVENNLNLLIEDSHKLAYKHTVKAEAINEKVWDNPDENVFGVVYEIKGNAASSLQFYLTDSVRNFVRGALYFSVEPEKDSLAPVIDFFSEDVIHLIESFRWKDN